MRQQPFLALALLASLTAASQSIAAETADSLYFGGDIVTVNPAQPSAEALMVKDGKILAVGNRAELENAYGGPATERIDLAGKTLIPSFIDPHSHYFSALSVVNQVNLFPPPIGPGKDIPSIVAELKAFRDTRNIPPGVMIQAFGYDNNAMPGGIGLSRDDLDRDFPDNPVMVGHISMHGAVLNSAALKKYNISATTITPPGGVIERKPGSNEPAGLVMEMAYLPIFASLPKPTAEEELTWTRAAHQLYAQAGITTAHEGATHARDLAVMQRAAAGGANSIDLIAYPFITDLDAVLKNNPADSFGRYNNRLKLGGVKITIDGSPQARTALFSTPYLTAGPNGEKDWLGVKPFTQQQLDQMVRRVYDLGLPVNLHANGDGAIDMLLKAHETVASGDLQKDRKVTVIHSQFVRPDQLELYAKYRMTPSFFTQHTYFFADTHILNRGKKQTDFISPMRTAIDMGLHPTNHTDYVVTPLDQLFVMWTAVNRISRNDVLIGGDQRIKPLEALQAITINAARQYGEEQSKGSLEAGKLADMVILSANPLTVEPMQIKDVKVLETFKEGQSIFKAAL
jgi:predicted amidohydrolase YtcJ